MPTLDTDRLAPYARFDMREKDARVSRVLAWDGLQATQLEREWSPAGQRGLPEGQLAAAPARMEYQPDADLEVSGTGIAGADLGEQGVRRYVANPRMGSAQFPGIYVGGPVRVEKDPRTGDLVCRQTLTRVRAAGQRWRLDANGVVEFFLYEEPEEGEPDAAELALNAAAAADEQLKAARPRRATLKKHPAPYRADWPERHGLELSWRHWTHESEAYLLAITAAEAAEIATAHGVATADWKVAGWRFEIDPETNGGIFAIECERRTVYTPASVADLKAQPHRIMPANRETLRAFGLRSDAKGEGYARGRVYRWEDILPAARSFLEYPDDITFLWTVVDGLSAAYPVYASRELNKAFQQDGRAWWYNATTTDTFAVAYKAGKFLPWWRVLEYRVEEREDGLLTFTAHVERPEWTNRDAGQGPDTATEALSATAGWGADLRETVPSVPRAEAETLLAAPPTKAGYLPASRAAQEKERGHADISTTFLRVWAYAGADVPPNLPTAGGITAPEIEERHETSGEGAGLTCRFYRVNPANAAALLATAKTLVCPSGKGYELRASGVRASEHGECTVWASSTKYKGGVRTDWFDEYTEDTEQYVAMFRRRKANVGEDWAGSADKQTDCPERDEMRVGKVLTYYKATSSRSDAYNFGSDVAGKENVRVTGSGRRWYAQYELRTWSKWFADSGTVDNLKALYDANLT